MVLYGVCGHISILDINKRHSEVSVLSLCNYGAINVLEH